MLGKKKSFLPVALGAVVVAAGGATAAYLLLKGPGPGGLTPLGSAKVVPDEAIAVGYVNLDSEGWSRLERFGTPEARKYLTESMKKFEQDMLKETQVSYEADLKPWVGSVMFAALPPGAAKPVQQATPPAAPESNVLMVIGIKDKANALKFANKMKARTDLKTKEIDYKGVKINATTSKSTTNYSAQLSDYVVLSGNQKSVELAIDAYKGDPSFASKQGTSSLLSKDLGVKNPIAQIYIPDYASAVQQLAASNPNATPLPPQALEQLKQVTSLSAGMGVDGQGLRVKAFANLNPDLVKFDYKPSAGKIVSAFPADTMALLTGEDMNRYWQQTAAQLDADPNTKAGLNQARQQFKAAANLDLDKEVFGWMNGEFALAALPTTTGLTASAGFGGVIVVDTSDRKTAETTLGKLDDLAKKGNLQVAQRTIGDRTVTEWQIPQQGVLMGHGWLDQDSVFLAIGAPLVETMANKPQQSLDNSDTFKTATGSLPKPNLGYFYLDMEKVMVLMNKGLQAQPNSVPPQTLAILNSIRGVGASAVIPNKTTSEFELLFALKPAQ